MSSSMGSVSRSSRVSMEHAICENLVGTTERNLRIVLRLGDGDSEHPKLRHE